MEHNVRVKWPQPAQTPSVGPRAPREAGAAVTSMSVSDAGDRGSTIVGLKVQADDVAGAKTEARRLADFLALQWSITAEPMVEVVAKVAHVHP